MTQLVRRVLITGSRGFIGKNLMQRLTETPDFEVSTFNRGDDWCELVNLVDAADMIIHLAGENRPKIAADFFDVNVGLTAALCEAIKKKYLKCSHGVPLVFASSIQAEQDNLYGQSKRAAEGVVKDLAEATHNPVVIFRFPGVFGKWCKPNYNSVVSTYCYNIARNLPIQIDNPNTNLRLVYVEDLVSSLIEIINKSFQGFSYGLVKPEYEIRLGDLAEQIRVFATSRSSLMVERVGLGFLRALYSTYISYLPNNSFSYEIPLHRDVRGDFVEMLKTPDCGQFSYFTAHPGVTRGGHYHHSKTEKFLVVRGRALFRFRHLITNEYLELLTSDDKPLVVDTIPGWAHDITNVGEGELVVMLWASENFDQDRSDTISSKVQL